MNFSGMFDSEGFSLFPWVRPVEMWDILGTNCFCDDDAQTEIARRLAGLPFDAVHWIDAGDYHYVSKIRAGLIDRPFDIVMFDNHPDTHESDFSEMLNCGGWLYTALGTNPNLDHAIVAGRVVESVVTLPLGRGEDGVHSLVVSPSDPAIVFEKIVVDAGGYRQGYLFGDESVRTRKMAE